MNVMIKSNCVVCFFCGAKAGKVSESEGVVIFTCDKHKPHSKALIERSIKNKECVVRTLLDDPNIK